MAGPWDVVGETPIAAPAQSTANPWSVVGESPADTTWRGVGKNIGAGLAVDAPSFVGNVLTDPVGTLVLHPLAIAGGTAFDAAARALGYQGMSPEQRADLYGQPQPQQRTEGLYGPPKPAETQVPPEQQPLGTRVMNAVDAAIPGQQAADLPATPTERVVRAVTGGAATGGVGGVLPAVAAGVGAGVGDVASQYVPDWLKPGVELAGNVAGAGGVGGVANMVRTPVGLVDAGKAALVKTGIDKYNIPFEASDLTADPRFQRTGPASVEATAAKQQALQGAIINEMGGDGTRFTNQPGGLMDRTVARTSQVYDDIANRTTIGQPQTDNLVHNDLAAIEANLDNVAGITDSDRAAIKKNLNEIVNTVQPNGTISGADYKSMIKTNSPLWKLENNSNSEVANVGADIRDSLQAAFRKSASPEDQAALAKNDYQYRIMKTVAPLVAKSVDGNIDPGQFMTQVAQASRRFDPTLGGMAYTGGGNIGELARMGSLMNVKPSFAPKGDFAGKLLKVGEGVGGAMAAGHFIDPSLLVAAGAVPAYLAANAGRNAYLRSDFGRNALLQNALMPPPSPYAGVVPSLAIGGNTNQLLRLPPPQ